MKLDTAITCDEIYGVKTERGELQVQLVGVRLDAFIEEYREEVVAYLNGESGDE